MPKAVCIRPCFDNQTTKYYERGDEINMEKDSLLDKTGCFHFVDESKPAEEQVIPDIPDYKLDPIRENQPRRPGRPSLK